MRLGEKMDTIKYAGDEISAEWTLWFLLWLPFILLPSSLLFHDVCIFCLFYIVENHELLPVLDKNCSSLQSVI